MSAWHETPAYRLGLLGVAVMLSIAASLSRPVGLAAWAAVVLLGLAATPGSWRVMRRLVGPLGSCLLASVLLLLLTPTPAGPPAGTPPAAFLAALWLRAVLVACCVAIAVQHLSERDLLEGLQGLRLPRRLCALAYLMVRNVRQIAAAARQMVHARDARGAPRGWYAVRVAGAIAGTLLLRLGQRAETQALALVARGFEGGLDLVEPRRLTLGQGLLLAGLAGLGWWLVHWG